MAAEHFDILNKPLAAGDHVVFCQAGSSKRMTVGTVARVLPKTVEVSFFVGKGIGSVLPKMS